MAVLRSPMAHARITRVDVEPARQRPGVVAAYSGADLADSWSSLPMAWTVSEDQKTPPHMPLATDKVRYVGDGLAVVLATDPYAAADALEAIEVDYEPLPAVVDMQAALADGTPLVHDDIPNNRCFTFRLDNGDFEATRSRADVVLKRRFYNQRLIPNAMEPRAVVVAPTSPTGQVTVWSATQVPHFVRIFVALNTGVPEHQIRVIAPDVGGGFGSKLDIYAEEIIAFVVARKLGKPVKWTESRSENYQATIHGRDVIQDVELTATRDGRVLGLKVDLTADMGAYLQLLTPCIPLLGRYMYPGIYKFEAHTLTCQGVFTNKTPTDAYRGAGRPEATFVIERIMDELAAELSMDPIELRRRNWIKHEEFPYTTVAGLTYDSGNYEAATAKALDLFRYDELRREQAERRERGDVVQLGLGTSTYTEMCGLAPSRWLGEQGYAAGGWETATVRMLATGRVEVVTGTSPHGQGHETTFAQIAADTLGVSVRRRGRHPRRHAHRAVRPGHVRFTVAGGRWGRRADGRAEGRREGHDARLTPDGGRPRRPGVPGRDLPGEGHAGRAEVDPGDRVRRVLRTFAARRHAAGADRRPHRRPGGVLVPARNAPVRGRGRHRDRDGEDPVVRRRRRRRQGGQSHDRRRPGARRCGPGHRAGAVRGGGLRRRREPGHRHDGRLPGADRRRPAGVRHRPDRDAGDDEPARRQGRRRGGHHRVDTGRRQRGGGRRTPVRRVGRADAVLARTGVAGHPAGPRPDGGAAAPKGTIAYGGPQTATTAGGAE